MQMKRFMMGSPYTDEEFLTPSCWQDQKEIKLFQRSSENTDDVQQAI